MSGSGTGKSEDTDDINNIDDIIKEINLINSEEIKSQDKKWGVHDGMNPALMQRLYTLFANENSEFYFYNVSSIESPNTNVESKLVPPYYFTNDTEDSNVALFLPDIQYQFITFNSGDTGKFDVNCSSMELLKQLKPHITSSKIPTRFIIPLAEKPMPSGSGSAHSVLLCMDYDPNTMTLNPCIFDSLSRGAFDAAAATARRKTHSTCDAELGQSFTTVFTSTNIKLATLKRYAYGHQNRLTEGNCGTYTLRCITLAANSFHPGSNFDQIYNRIPTPNGVITANNFLSQKHIEDVETTIRSESDYNLKVLSHIKRTKDLYEEYEAVSDDSLKLEGVRKSFSDHYLQPSVIKKLKVELVNFLDHFQFQNGVYNAGELRYLQDYINAAEVQSLILP